MQNLADENKLHAYTEDGERCCKVCWDWLKTNFPVKVEEKEEQV
jgi:hypothetical protein